MRSFFFLFNSCWNPEFHTFVIHFKVGLLEKMFFPSLSSFRTMHIQLSNSGSKRMERLSDPRRIKEWHPEGGKGEKPLDDWKRLMSEPYEEFDR